MQVALVRRRSGDWKPSRISNPSDDRPLCGMPVISVPRAKNLKLSLVRRVPGQVQLSPVMELLIEKSRTLTISIGPVHGHLAALIHLTEVTVHGIDLAVATSQEHSIDEAAAERLLETMQLMGVMEQVRVPGVFEPERNASASHAPHRRLMAFLSRSADFRPTAQPYNAPSALRL